MDEVTGTTIPQIGPINNQERTIYYQRQLDTHLHIVNQHIQHNPANHLMTTAEGCHSRQANGI